MKKIFQLITCFVATCFMLGFSKPSGLIANVNKSASSDYSGEVTMKKNSNVVIKNVLQPGGLNKLQVKFVAPQVGSYFYKVNSKKLDKNNNAVSLNQGGSSQVSQAGQELTIYNSTINGTVDETIEFDIAIYDSPDSKTEIFQCVQRISLGETKSLAC